MDIIKVCILYLILCILINIRASINEWGEKLVLTKVTTVKHIYNYEVESYGTISLNDKLDHETADYIKTK